MHAEEAARVQNSGTARFYSRRVLANCRARQTTQPTSWNSQPPGRLACLRWPTCRPTLLAFTPDQSLKRKRPEHRLDLRLGRIGRTPDFSAGGRPDCLRLHAHPESDRAEWRNRQATVEV